MSGLPTLRGRLWSQGVWIAVATTVANLLGYGFNLICTRGLGPDGFGELAALLAIALVLSVPGTALQASVARQIARGQHDPVTPSAVLLYSAALGGALGLAVAASAPLLVRFLDISSYWSVVALALSVVPATVVFGVLGILQGHTRFTGLGVVLVGMQLARVAAAVGAMRVARSVSGVLWATVIATGMFALAASAAVILPDGTLRWFAGLGSEVVRDSSVVLSTVLLTNVDVLLARHYLSEYDAGIYAAGNLITKAAFWGPAFVATVAYPRLTRRQDRGAALLFGARALGSLSLLAIAGSVVLAPLIPTVLGSHYGLLRNWAWLFALQGAALAVTLFGVYAGLAVHDRLIGAIVWVVFVAEVAAVSLRWHASVPAEVITMATGSTALALFACARCYATRDRGSEEPLAS